MSTDCFDHEVENLAFECDLSLPEARQVAHLGLNAIDPDVHHEVLDSLAQPAVASAYFEVFFAAFPDTAAELVESQARRALGTGHDNAGVWTAVAHAAEHRGDVAGWIDHLDTALRRDPTFVPALLDRGYAAWLQGDHDTVHRLLDEVDHPRAHVMCVAIGLCEPVRLRVARNRRCPCGSGLKSKRCCRGTFQLPMISDRLLWTKLQIWLSRFPQDRARRALAVELADGDASEDFLRAVLCEGVTSAVTLFEGGLIDRFTATFGHLVPPSDLATLGRWRAVRHRLWEVVAVDGRTVELIDLVEGQERRVFDDGRCRCVVPGGILYAAVLPAGGGWFMPRHLPLPALEAGRIAGRMRRGDDLISVAVDVYSTVEDALPM